MSDDVCKFFYQFDQKDHLIQVTLESLSSGNKKVVFNRQHELDNEIKKYKEQKNGISNVI
ncbi:hypothetical protein CHCC5027_3405 [Bacillus paralicheniformis]|nr:hypothetical protein CHCC5027_3405 [Bacillus paralicheniformis]